MKGGEQMNNMFPEVKKNFGFGCMRLPMLPDGEVDLEQCGKMAEKQGQNQHLNMTAIHIGIR